jgi:hypothetical protein
MTGRDFLMGKMKPPCIEKLYKRQVFGGDGYLSSEGKKNNLLQNYHFPG